MGTLPREDKGPLIVGGLGIKVSRGVKVNVNVNETY